MNRKLIRCKMNNFIFALPGKYRSEVAPLPFFFSRKTGETSGFRDLFTASLRKWAETKSCRGQQLLSFEPKYSNVPGKGPPLPQEIPDSTAELSFFDLKDIRQTPSIDKIISNDQHFPEKNSVLNMNRFPYRITGGFHNRLAQGGMRMHGVLNFRKGGFQGFGNT